jgi:hypothetical protein
MKDSKRTVNVNNFFISNEFRKIKFFHDAANIEKKNSFASLLWLFLKNRTKRKESIEKQIQKPYKQKDFTKTQDDG